MCMQIATPDDQAADIQYDIAGPGLGSAWIVAGFSEMPVSTKVGVDVHLESLDDFVVQHDSLCPCGLEVIDQVDYHVPV